MFNSKQSWFKSPLVLGTLCLLSSPAVAEETKLEAVDLYRDPIYSDINNTDDSMSQVTNVNQLRDVSPTDWAYEALRSLVERYGCISGFPNQTYRGDRPLSRYEFAAGLNSCLNQIERLIASSEAVAREDVETLQRLMQEFEAELVTIGSRIDNLEGRTAFLEDNAFSTTTVLQGEVAFTLAQAFGDEAAIDTDGDGENESLDSQIVFNERIRLQFVSSFTGEDKLFTRLTAGNIDNSFQDEIGTREGRFAYDGPAGNNVVIDRLHYLFPVGENLTVTAMASLAAHHFYAETFNPGLNTGGGATGALSRFGERNPIYRQGIDRGSAGLGLNYTLGEILEFSAGYIAPNGSDPSEGNGLFNGSYSALGQVTFKPTEKLKLGATYVRGYDSTPYRGSFLWGGTGTNLGNLRLAGLGVEETPVTTNSFGGEVQFDFSPKFSLRGWFSYTDADLLDSGDATILNYAGALVVYDLLKEGSLAALVVGAEPYLNDLDLEGDEPEFEDDIPLHVEAFYRYQLNDNISITPGIIWLISPNQDSDNNDVFIGALRTTFVF